MSRYIRNEAIGKPADFVDFIMSDFIAKQGFTLVNINGETMYQKGKGFLEMPRYFSYRYMNGVIHIEAWVRFAWLPGVYGKESDMSGFVGSVPKNAYKEDIEELIRVLYQPLPGEQPNPYGGYGQPGQNGMQGGYGQPGQNGMQGGYGQPMQNGMQGGYGQPGQNGVQGGYGQPMQNGPITVKGIDMKKRAKTGFILVIVGLLFFGITVLVMSLEERMYQGASWTIWGCSMLYAGLGTGYSYRGMSSSKSGLATAGFVIGILELIGGILLLALGMM